MANPRLVILNRLVIMREGGTPESKDRYDLVRCRGLPESRDIFGFVDTQHASSVHFQIERTNLKLSS